MNPIPDSGLLQQLFFEHNYFAGQYERMIDRMELLLRYSGSTLFLSIIGCVVLCTTILLIYRPKLTRGALWLPAFGLFGGRPTLYMHTRPTSVCGIFSTTRRLNRARAAWRTEKRKRNSARNVGETV